MVFKRTTSMIVIASLLLSVPSFAAASTDKVVDISNYAHYGSPIGNEEEEYQLMLKDKEIENDAQKIQPYAIDPGVGATKIVTYRYATGLLVEQDSKSGNFDTIKNISLLIVGTLVDTVSGVVISIADILGSALDPGGYVTAKTYTSYSYFGKEGQVWTSSNIWTPWFDSRSRDTFKHYYSSYKGKDGYTHTGQKDFITPKGYSPVRTEYSPHYFNDSWIQNKAWQNWYTNEQSEGNKTEYWYN